MEVTDRPGGGDRDSGGSRIAVGEAANEIFAETLRRLVALLPAQRVLILFDRAGAGSGAPALEALNVEASHGIEVERLWEGAVSTELLRDVLVGAEPLLLSDASDHPEYGGNLSVLLAGTRAALAVPLRDQDGRVRGVLYADHNESSVFRYTDLGRVIQLARDIETRLLGREPVPGPDLAPPPARGVARVKPPGSPAQALPRRTRPRRGAPLRARVLFFRSLAVLVGAGVPLASSFDILSRQAEHPGMASACQEVARGLRGGSSIWQALSESGAGFSWMELALVRVGEATGGLPLILERLARLLEREHAALLKVRSALTYPGLVTLVCLALVLLVPPYLFNGLFQVFRSLNVELPVLTRSLMALSDLLRSPVFYAAAAGVLWLLALAVRRLDLPRVASRLVWLRGIGPVLRSLALMRFARALSELYNAGIRIDRAVSLAAAASGNVVLEELSPAVIDRILDGASLSGALQQVGFFPPLFIQTVVAGEEAGRLPGMLAEASDLYELELEHRLEIACALIEPCLMLGMGILVGIMVIGTSLPMVHLVQSL